MRYHRRQAGCRHNLKTEIETESQSLEKAVAWDVAMRSRVAHKLLGRGEARCQLLPPNLTSSGQQLIQSLSTQHSWLAVLKRSESYNCDRRSSATSDPFAL